MSIVSDISTKLYYRTLNCLIPTTQVKLEDSFKGKRNIFIYFDYEREFSGHETNITDSNIKYILKLLNDHGINTTWFTVGKIIKKYPDSIHEIIKNDHEIGSHTYSHIPPLKSSNRELKEDFKLFNQDTHQLNSISGFHSPRGQWAFKIYKLLKQYGFVYEVVGSRKHKNLNPTFLNYRFKDKILRFKTVGDDWLLFKSKYTKEEVLDFFIMQSKKINKGEFAGIGFHPWLMFSDDNILHGFELFLQYLSNNNELQIKSINYFINNIKD